MTLALEEALRLLHIAQDDRDAFLVLKESPHIRLPVAFFHARQAVKKTLKAVLAANGFPIGLSA